MDLINDTNSDDLGTDKVSDDMLLYLAKHYLKEQDCLALAISGSSYNFPSLYAANRKRLAIGRCFFLTPTAWTRFFEGYISPQSIITFDASHAYWLPAEVLIQSTVQMTNLEELLMDDTKVSLSHFPKIFEACQKVVKLSLTLNGKSLNEELIEKASLDVLKKGFAKLTHLKMFNFNTDEEAYPFDVCKINDVEPTYDFWLRILQVLKWGRDCIDLAINLTVPAGDDYFFVLKEDEETLDRIYSEHFPLLGWMKNLKSLTILRNGNSYVYKEFIFMEKLIGWLLPQLQHLERLWLPEDYGFYDFIDPFSVLRSINVLMKLPNLADNALKGEQFASLEHISGEFNFNQFGLHPHLKYAVGYCEHDKKALNEFCRSHPKLEQLHIDDNDTDDSYTGNDIEQFGEGDWSLLLLKTFVYRCDPPSKKIIQQVIKKCPNIEELHIETENQHDPIELMPIDYFSEFRFKHLRRLSIDGSHHVLSDVSSLPQIFNQCPKLESLQLNGDMAKPFFDQLILCLPAAANLRDLRLAWEFTNDYDFSPLLQFMEAILLNSSILPYSERLVLKVWETFYCKSFKRNSANFPEVEKFILPFAKGMTHLVGFGLFGFPFDPSAAEVIRRKLTEEVVPHREAFWFHLDDGLPEGNDSSVARIHYDEIVAPISAYSAPPKF